MLHTATVQFGDGGDDVINKSIHYITSAFGIFNSETERAGYEVEEPLLGQRYNSRRLIKL